MVLALLANNIPRTSFLRPEPEALTYAAAVETEDTQQLEFSVKSAYNNYIRGCKSDAIWLAHKASCILAGARTLAGALVPLVGSAPTNVGGLFVSSDYNRKTGLKGELDSNKYLDSNRAGNADPQNSSHLSVFVTDATNSNTFVIAAGGNNLGPGRDYIDIVPAGLRVDCRTFTAYTDATRSINTNCLIGVSRSASGSFNYRASGITVTTAVASVAPAAPTTKIFGRNSTPLAVGDPRLLFYSIGESLTLALQDSRLTTLNTQLNDWIP